LTPTADNTALKSTLSSATAVAGFAIAVVVVVATVQIKHHHRIVICSSKVGKI